LLASMLFGTYLAVRYQPMEVLRMLAWALALTLLLSCAIVLAWPSRGVMISPYEGAWRGVFTHKNDLARMMLLNIVAVLVLLGSAQRYRKLLWIDLVASVIVLVEAQSATAFLCAMILGASAVMLAVCLRRPRYAPAVLALLPVLALAAWLSVDAVLAALGRDLTLTGRTGLWQALWPMIEARLWLGYGYQAFWIDPNGPAAVVWALAGWQAPSAHNGYLDLWLGLGLVGIVIFAAVFLQTLIRALRLARTVEGPRTYWTLLFLAMFLAYGFSEIVFMQQNDLFTVLFVIVALHSRLGAGRQVRRPLAPVAPPARRPVAAPLASTR
jgi:exopolysaccharide production protein ExoQ